MQFNEFNPATWGVLPRDYSFRTVDPVTGEAHLFAPDGTNLSVRAGVPEPRPFPPESAVNAAIVAAMLAHPHDPRYENSEWAQWCDMTPVVTSWHPWGYPRHCPDDVWVIEVQYSSRGGRAVYGVDRNNVPQCYAD